ncbi:hypothetical protein TrCOL_g5305 [Triparma columacea]|uniref:Uncharacterized protein n=1 Tax=Triparma columacea TaxID=722753 RepID=A0A9W7GJZ0_9STRA|nr:hypothetical protein TrCOL_g5305 [Triparma columacea]
MYLKSDLKEDASLLWTTWSVTWYACMCTLATFNLLLCFKLFLLSPRSVSSGTLSSSYRLTLIFASVCAYRSYFPTIYLTRSCFIESSFSGILIARLMAFVGELCWMYQVSNSLKSVNRALSRHPLVNVLADTVVILIAGQSASVPLYILVRAYMRSPIKDPSIRLYLIIFVSFMFIYDIWGVTTDVRSNWDRYTTERDEIPSPWLGFEAGLDEVTSECQLDRSWETWGSISCCFHR